MFDKIKCYLEVKFDFRIYPNIGFLLSHEFSNGWHRVEAIRILYLLKVFSRYKFMPTRKHF